MSRRFIITGIVHCRASRRAGVLPVRLQAADDPHVPVADGAAAGDGDGRGGAQVEKWVEQLTSIGTLIASQGVDVTTQVAGIVTEIFFESGQDVEQGAKLVQLDIAVELADLASAKATLQEAEVAFQRQADLMQQARDVGGQPRYRARQARHGAGRRQAHRGGDRAEGDRGAVQRPARHPQGGEGPVRVGGPGACRRCRRSTRSASISRCPSSSIGKLRVGQPVELTVDAYPGQVFKGEIQSLDARVAQDTRTLLVRGILPNKERKLLPGMFANVTVQAGEPTDVITVPRTAVTYSLYGDSVYVVKPAPAKEGQGRRKPAAPQARSPAGRRAALIAERRFVQDGRRCARTASPSLSGLAAGEQVVTTGQLKLNPGASIRIDNTQPLIRPDERPKQ